MKKKITERGKKKKEKERERKKERDGKKEIIQVSLYYCHAFFCKSFYFTP